MYDKSVIDKHLTALLLDLKNLAKYKNVTKEEITANTDLLWILERGIYLSLQNIFDSLSHIISASLNKKWESYADISSVLFDEGMINESRRDLLISMAGFRNRLSHDYLGLDLDIIIDIVSNRLDDFYFFAKLISKYAGK
jgi:uncharacterized protein YutE (UPF0331/DUF86 family)